MKKIIIQSQYYLRSGGSSKVEFDTEEGDIQDSGSELICKITSIIS